MRVQYYVFIVLLAVIGCTDENGKPSWFSESVPVFGFSELIEGKEVQMTEELGDSFFLALTDTTSLKVKFSPTATGQLLQVQDWQYKFDKAVKYKKYYFLHQKIDSTSYKVVVVGKYFSKYYGFSNINDQNFEIQASLFDSIRTEQYESLARLKMDSISEFNFIVSPSDKRTIRDFYDAYLESEYLRLADDKVSEMLNTIDETEELIAAELDIIEEAKIYPNPTSKNYVYIASDLLKLDNAEILITTLEGKEVLREVVSAKSKVKIKLSDVDPGTYVVTISGGGQKVTGKLVVID